MKKTLSILFGCIAALAISFVAVNILVFSKPVPQNEHDVAIIERAIALLENEEDWSRQDDRTCGPEKQGLSLFCALVKASIEVTGQYVHRAAALQEVRYAIDRHSAGKDYSHRLMDYNNDENVSFEQMHALLQEALANLKQDWQASHSQ